MADKFYTGGAKKNHNSLKLYALKDIADLSYTD